VSRIWERRLRKKVVAELHGSAAMGVLSQVASPGEFWQAIRQGEQSHGCVAALHLIGPESGYLDVGARRKLIQEQAAAAVFHHHSDRPSDLDFRKRPLSFLLALADECHEFGREMLVWSERSASSRTGEFIPPVPHARFLEDGPSSFNVEFCLRSDDSLGKLRDAGFDLAKFTDGKREGFARLDPLAADGTPVNGLTFSWRITHSP